jgi:hypothetical protein
LHYAATLRRGADGDGRGSRSFRQHWHERTVDLHDCDVLRWLVIARPGVEPWIAYFRRDRRGSIHASEGRRLLVDHGHPDAALSTRGDVPSPPFTH